jgi:hypothetical protein
VIGLGVTFWDQWFVFGPGVAFSLRSTSSLATLGRRSAATSCSYAIRTNEDPIESYVFALHQCECERNAAAERRPNVARGEDRRR